MAASITAGHVHEVLHAAPALDESAPLRRHVGMTDEATPDEVQHTLGSAGFEVTKFVS
jgi:hypothetical protein